MARRPIWSGSISFALINVPVKLLSAVAPKEVHFHMLHDADGGRIKEKRVCEKDGKEVPYGHIVKGYELGPGKHVMLDKEELSALDPEADKTISVEEFVELSEIDPVFFQNTYYLIPDKGAGAAKAFSLFLGTLERTKKAAIARIVLRTRQYLCALRPVKNGLALNTLWFADEINDIPKAEGAPAKVNEKELRMAESLVESLSNPFKPAKYKDEHRDKVLAMIEKKAKGEEIVVAPVAETKGKPLSLMEALEASLSSHKKGAGQRPPARAGRHRAAAAPPKRARARR